MSDEHSGGAGGAAGRSVFIPGLLLALAALAWNGFQTYQMVGERSSFAAVIAGQEPQIEQSRKVRAALENIATRTARIAQAGNPNATIIVEELRKRGITINPEGQSPAEPAAP